MATLRQKKLAKELADNSQADKPLNAGALLEKVGYSKNTAESKSGEIINADGVQKELARLGFDPDSAKEVVGQILYEGENDGVKLKAADMIFKVHGSYAPEKQVNINLNGESTERSRELGHRMLGLLRR